MDTKEIVRQLVVDYFEKRPSGSARDVHFRIGRSFPYSVVCAILDELEKEGMLTTSVVKATKFIRAHYVYYKVDKKESLIQRLLKFVHKFI